MNRLTRPAMKVASKFCIPIAAGLFLMLLLRSFASTLSFCSGHLTATSTVILANDRSKHMINRSVRLPSVCVNESCRADYVRYLQSKDAHPIPAIRHILWRNESVSAYFAEQLRSWQRIHPDWTFVLWRDQDLEPFVTAHFPGLLAKFKSLPSHIMRVDMIRYMLLFKYGGAYADLDYSLVGSLDDFRRFQAVVTREPEAHSLELLQMSWPIKVLANPAFLMSTPSHIFLHYMMQILSSRSPNSNLFFAGPFALTEILEKYDSQFSVANSALETVYVPPSNSFYPYTDNRLNSSRSAYLGLRFSRLNNACQSMRNSDPKQQWKQDHPLRQFCADVNNLDPITDRSQPVFAVHDLNKAGAAYDGVGAKFYNDKLTDARVAVPKLKLGEDFMLTL